MVGKVDLDVESILLLLSVPELEEDAIDYISKRNVCSFLDILCSYFNVGYTRQPHITLHSH